MSVIVHAEGDGRTAVGLAGALRWAVLDSSSPRKWNKSIRSQASLVGASSYTTKSFDEARFLGLYTKAVFTAGHAAEIKILHSLAIAFLEALTHPEVDDRTINAILLMIPQNQPEKRALVVIEGGMIVRDVIEGVAEAIANVQRARESLPGHIVYSQHPEVSGSESISWEELLLACNTDSLLRPIPNNPSVVIGIAALIIGVAGYIAYDKLVVEPQAKIKRLKSIAAADKTPAYRNLLESSLANLGWDRQDLTSSLISLEAYPFYGEGWSLEKRECNVILQGCVSTWHRNGGQNSGLIKMLPNEAYDVTGSTLTSALTILKRPMKGAQLSHAGLHEVNAAAAELRNQLQLLATADIVITSWASEKWPSMDFRNVLPSAIATRSGVEIIAPLPKAVAVLASLPSSVVIDGYTLTVGSGDLGSLFNIKFKGYVYAK